VTGGHFLRVLIEIFARNGWIYIHLLLASFFSDAGSAKSEFSRGMLASMLLIVIVDQDVGSFFGPAVIEKGKIRRAMA